MLVLAPVPDVWGPREGGRAGQGRLTICCLEQNDPRFRDFPSPRPLHAAPAGVNSLAGVSCGLFPEMLGLLGPRSP